MPSKIYERQVVKESLAARVVDEQQVDRHFVRHSIELLYEFEPKLPVKPVELLPNDTILADLLREEDSISPLIGDYHEHDSLLTSHSEKGLTVSWHDSANMWLIDQNILILILQEEQRELALEEYVFDQGQPIRDDLEPEAAFNKFLFTRKEK